MWMLTEWGHTGRTSHLTAAMLPLFLLTLVAVTVSAGTIDQRIINGDVVKPHTYPAQLSLQLNGAHICGAVLLNHRFAITAAHCVNIYNPHSYTLMCGAHDLSVSEKNRQKLQVDWIVTHPYFNPNNNQPAFANDIALLRLAKSVRITTECKTAVLPHPSQNFSGQAAVITGWGHTSGDNHNSGYWPTRLKEGKVTVLSEAECEKMWSSAVDRNFHICVKDLQSGYYGSCVGDSGGPAHVGEIVVGLTSFGAAGCLTGYPSVYVRLSNYRYWIEETVAQMWPH